MTATKSRPHNFVDLTGKRFGRLEVLSYFGTSVTTSGRKSVWMCECDCGQTAAVQGVLLNRGTTQSCGCLMIERTKQANTTHGHKRRNPTRVYRIWSGIQTRCLNQSDKSYARYGAVGITVCDRWRAFEPFLADMGEPPTVKHTIDRIDGRKGYEPGNCRWATWTEQALNRRKRSGAKASQFIGVRLSKAGHWRANFRGANLGCSFTTELAAALAYDDAAFAFTPCAKLNFPERKRVS